MLDKFQTQKTEQDLLIINCGTIIINPDAVTPLLCTCSIISIEMKVFLYVKEARFLASSLGHVTKKIYSFRW